MIIIGGVSMGQLLKVGVEKLAGKISAMIIAEGQITGQTPATKSFSLSFFNFNNLAVYTTKTIFAKSDVWKLRFMNGIFSQREALFKFTPISNVSKSRNTVGQYNKKATLE
jgi:hypothetical protein